MILQLIIKQWRVILLVLILAVTFYYKHAYNATTQELDALKLSLAVETAKNTQLALKAKEELANQVKKYNDIEKELNFNKDELSKKVKDLYDFKTNANNRLSAYAQRLSMPTSNQNSNIASDTSDLAECRSNFDAAYTRIRTIEKACSLTTNNYNLLRGWANNACNIAECK